MAVKQSKAINRVKKVGAPKGQRKDSLRASPTDRDSTLVTSRNYGDRVLPNAYEDIP